MSGVSAMELADILAVPERRREQITTLADVLRPGTRVALSTHMNADGDGCGSQAALAELLAQRGCQVHIVNPTPWPELFRYLLGGDVVDASAKGAAALRDIDVLAVLDINDIRRLGNLGDAVRALTVPIVVIDHHQPGDEPPSNTVLADTAACATGELVYDMARELGLEITPSIARALYTALMTDTGGFRFANTGPRTMAIAGVLLAAGVDPEEMYRRIYASVPVGRLHLLREVLASLEVDEPLGLSWVSLEAGMMERFKVTSEDLDGIVEHPRSIAGTRLALFFRDLGHGKVKVSFRSTGTVDVNALARQFGGGGHMRASGALVVGSLSDVRTQVVAAAREFLTS
jgi:bifunctional oligoribonuclease and PAP phosphatase NrnA